MVEFEAKGPNGKVFLKDGELMIENEGELLPLSSCTFQKEYEREKKPKILLKFPAESSHLNLNRSLSEFDILYAVDTNTIEVSDKFYSIGTIVICELEKKVNELKANYSIMNIIESVNEYRHPNIEQVMWKGAIEHIISNDKLKSTEKVGFVVDCDLGNLNKYNSKELPIFDKFYLPDNFKLIYASADSGNEYLPNKLIKLADSEATKILKSKYKKL